MAEETRPFIGYRSAGRRPESKQDRRAAADAPLSALRGMVSGVLGAPGDIESLVRMLPGLNEQTVLPTSEDIERRLPMPDLNQTPAGRAFTTAGQLGGGFYTGPGSPLRAIAALPSAVSRAGRDFLMASGKPASPMVVWHGSPHKFDKFDASKIGTGEGAQAYGYGLYLAESPDVANQYRQMLASKAYSKLEKVDRNNYRVTAPDGTVITEGVTLGPATKAKDAFDAKAGNLMQVDLPDEQIARMLDYDKPLSEQPKSIQDFALRNAPELVRSVKFQQSNPLNENFAPKSIYDLTGHELYSALQRTDRKQKKLFKQRDALVAKYQGRGMSMADAVRAMNADDRAKFSQIADEVDALKNAPAAASEMLRQAGIPGIRYFDAGSRAVPNITNKRLADLYAKHGGNADAAVDEMMRSVYNTPKKKEAMREQFMKQLQTPKTSNFVVFPGEEDALTILERNGEPLEDMLRRYTTVDEIAPQAEALALPQQRAAIAAAFGVAAPDLLAKDSDMKNQNIGELPPEGFSRGGAVRGYQAGGAVRTLPELHARYAEGSAVTGANSPTDDFDPARIDAIVASLNAEFQA